MIYSLSCWVLDERIDISRVCVRLTLHKLKAEIYLLSLLHLMYYFWSSRMFLVTTNISSRPNSSMMWGIIIQMRETKQNVLKVEYASLIQYTLCQTQWISPHGSLTVCFVCALEKKSALAPWMGNKVIWTDPTLFHQVLCMLLPNVCESN